MPEGVVDGVVDGVGDGVVEPEGVGLGDSVFFSTTVRGSPAAPV